MIRRMNLNLVLLGVVITCTYGAPPRAKNIDFKAILSNETRWPFLSACTSNSSSYDEFLCPEYLSAKVNVSSCKSDADDTEILLTPVSAFGNISLFCNVSFQGSVTRNVILKDDFQQKCELVCLEGKVKHGKPTSYIKPLCQLISWIRSSCVVQHDSGVKKNESAITAPKPSGKDTNQPAKTSILPQVSVSSNPADLPATTQNQSNLSNNATSTSNFSESPQKETPTIAKLNTTTPSVVRPKVDDGIPYPITGSKSNDTKTTVALPSTPAKKLSMTTANSGAETSLKAQNDDPVPANNSEQTNIDNVEQDEQSKIDDESIYDEAGDNIKDTDQLLKNADEYPNLDPIRNKPDVEQDSNNALGKDRLTQKSKAHTYFVESADSGSNFFSFFLFGMFLCILLYVVYHNKSKILALVLEGRRTSSSRSGSKRKHTAAYRKLDTNLEEAITSSASGRTSQIIY